MRDCDNAMMRDLLPDLLHDRLPASQRAEVLAHVEACAECRAELALLRQVLLATAAPRVDTSRIASALPSYRARSGWFLSLGIAQLRVAAAVVLLVGAAVISAWLLTRSTERVPEQTVETRSVPPPSVAATPETARVVAETATAPASISRKSAELALGETLHDLTDSELRQLLEELGDLDAVTSSEPEVVVPSPGRSGT